MKEIKTIEAKGNYVILKMHVKEKGEPYVQKKSGLYVPDEGPSQPAGGSNELELDHAEVYHISPDVDNPTFSVGDRVIFNEYDIKYVGSKENMFGITKAESIMAVYEPEEEE